MPSLINISDYYTKLWIIKSIAILWIVEIVNGIIIINIGSGILILVYNSKMRLFSVLYVCFFKIRQKIIHNFTFHIPFPIYSFNLFFLLFLLSSFSFFLFFLFPCPISQANATQNSKRESFALWNHYTTTFYLWVCEY